MHALIWLGLVSFGLSLVLTPIFRDVFRSYGVVDEPDQGRKIHKYPIPRVGGIAIATAYLASIFIVQLRTGILDQELALVWKILPAAAVIFAVGVIDDLWGLKPWQKLIGQVAAATLALWSGVRIVDVIGVHADAWWTIPATILWLLVCTNAFNLVDGMDGLAAGVGMFATLTIFIAAMVHNNLALAMATLPLAGCLLGFLCYNFNPATIFLGDSGSLLIGFLLGCYGIIWTHKSATLLGMTAPLMALSLPILDVTLAVTRRFLRRQPIFSADRGHIHHRLLDRGLSPRKAALILYGICSLVAIFSLLQSVAQNDRISGVIVILFCAVAWVGIQYLGYAEFTLAGRLLFRGDFQRTLKAQLDLHAFEKAISECRKLEDCIKLVREMAHRFGFIVVEFDVCGRRFSESFVRSSTCWETHVPLSDNDFIALARDFNAPEISAAAGPFIEVLRNGLAARLPFFGIAGATGDAAVQSRLSLGAVELPGPERAA
jgi:UDP-GlcNAc:undecaprenyl-phosphate/decaprenyl-phosphate GlcNAc-1-phosphate transferase